MTETKFSLTKNPHWKRTLKVEVPAARVEPRIDKFLADYQAKAQIPGFRKGKAPKEVIRKKFLGAYIRRRKGLGYRRRGRLRNFVHGQTV